MNLVDSSAWLAHLFGEPGVDEVSLILDDQSHRVSISALSIPEIFARLKAIGKESHWGEVWSIYSEILEDVIPVDEATAHRAVQIRASTGKRLPTIDGLVAASASINNLTLVHRDHHFTGISDPELHQMKLPNRSKLSS